MVGNASDTASLADGMLEILRQLHAPEVVTQAVRESAPAAAARAWEFLNGPHLAGRNWLVIFDNTYTPRVLGGGPSRTCRLSGASAAGCLVMSRS